MKNIIIISLILSIILISCRSTNKNDRTDLTDNEKELFELLEELSNEEDGTQKIDSSKLERIIELVENTNGKWKEIISKKGNFRIMFPPFEISEKENKQIMDDEVITVFSYSLNTQNMDHENLGYMVDYTPCPDIKTKKQIENEFNIQRDYVLSATNATLEYERIIDTLNCPGRHLYLTIDGSNIKANYRMYFHNGIFYKLTVITENGKHFNKSISKFLNSFQFLDDNN